MDEPIILDADDVTIEEVPPPLCDECGETATHRVLLAMRNNGTTSAVFEGCLPCVKEQAERLRASLKGAAAHGDDARPSADDVARVVKYLGTRSAEEFA